MATEIRSPKGFRTTIEIPPRRHKGNITFGRGEKTDIEEIVEICVSQVERDLAHAEVDSFSRKLSLLTAEISQLQRDLSEKREAIEAIEREFSKVDTLTQKAFRQLYADMTWKEIDLQSRLSALGQLYADMTSIDPESLLFAFVKELETFESLF